MPPLGLGPAPSPDGSGGASADRALAERQEQVIHAFSSLGRDLTGRLCLVLAQPELECGGIHELGFVDVLAGFPALEEHVLAAAVGQSSTYGVLVVSHGADVAAAAECCSAVELAVGTLPTVVVVVALGKRPDDDSEGEEAELQRARSLLTAGADDVKTLYGSETVCGFQMQLEFMRMEVVARKVTEVTAMEAKMVRKRMARKLELAWQHGVFRELPGTVLGDIPIADASLQEHFGLDEQVGEYRIAGQAVAASLHTMVRAEHPVHGTCALKIIAKQSVKSLKRFLGINSEIGILRNIPPHPGVARAHDALHGSNTIIIVLGYCGDLSLQRYAFMHLDYAVNMTFPPDVVASFCRQEAAAVAHLHSQLVCHRDLKPTNFTVSNDGTLLQLADFSLASLACGPDQRFRRCCGSLPFVAPEVLRVQLPCNGGGYRGFPADVWSLAVNFVDLGCGLSAVETDLGWAPNPPAEVEQRARGVEGMADVWRRNATPEAFALLDPLVCGMLTVEVPDRWCIERVVGRDGLGLSHEGDARPSDPSRRHATDQDAQDRESDILEMIDLDSDLTSRTIPEA